MSRTPIIGTLCIIKLSLKVKLTCKEQNKIKYNEKNLLRVQFFFVKVNLSEYTREVSIRGCTVAL